MDYARLYFGDYLADTMGLSMTEDGAYLRLLGYCYTRERPLPGDLQRIFSITRAASQEEQAAVKAVLSEFFELRDDGCYHNCRADKELAIARQARANGGKGGRPRKVRGPVVEGAETGTETGQETKIETDSGTGMDAEGATGLGHPPTTNHQPPTASHQPPLLAAPDGAEAPAARRGRTPAVLCPFEKLVAAYHAELPGNPRCMALSEGRKRQLRARWDFWRTQGRYDTIEEGITWWAKFFRYVGESAFLTGQAHPQPGRPPFVADIDFLASPEKNLQIVEGKYHAEVAAA